MGREFSEYLVKELFMICFKWWRYISEEKDWEKVKDLIFRRFFGDLGWGGLGKVDGVEVFIGGFKE